MEALPNFHLRTAIHSIMYWQDDLYQMKKVFFLRARAVPDTEIWDLCGPIWNIPLQNPINGDHNIDLCCAQGTTIPEKILKAPFLYLDFILSKELTLVGFSCLRLKGNWSRNNVPHFSINNNETFENEEKSTSSNLNMTLMLVATQFSCFYQY